MAKATRGPSTESTEQLMPLDPERDLRNRRVTMQKSALHLLDAPLPMTADSYEVLTSLGIFRPTVCDSVMLAMVLRAQRGDVDAARFLRDTSGQKSVVTLNTSPFEEDVDRLNLRELSDEELYALIAAEEAAGDDLG